MMVSSRYTPQQIKDITERISILRARWLHMVERRVSASERTYRGITVQQETQLGTGSKLEPQAFE
jgi:hypothetical protein